MMCEHCGYRLDGSAHAYYCRSTALDMCNRRITQRNNCEIASDNWRHLNDAAVMWWEIAVLLLETKKKKA